MFLFLNLHLDKVTNQESNCCVDNLKGVYKLQTLLRRSSKIRLNNEGRSDSKVCKNENR